MNDGSGNFTDSGQELGDSSSWGVSLADVDGDGNVDAFVANDGQPNKVWLNEPLNSAPTDLTLSNNTIDENVPANSVVGTFSTTDPDVGDTFDYELVEGDGDTDNEDFSIDDNQLKINASPDYETQSSYSIRLQTTDAGEETYQEELTININDVNEAPTALNLDNNSIDENEPANSVVGTFSTTDPDVGDTFTYYLAPGPGDTDNAAFTIDGEQLKINASPDYETQPSYSILVKTTDAEGASYQQQLTINVNDIDENPAPTIIGTPERDVLIGEDPGEIIQGLADQDLIYGNGGEDIIEGGDGNDLVYGGKDNDILYGNNHNDRLYGNNGNDELFGNDGNDILYGGPGDDLLNGGAGSDRYYGNGGSDTFVIGAGMGKDSIYYFEDEVDLIQLEGGLNFADLVIESWSSSTLIKYGEETLATLYQVDAALITQDDFV